MKVIVAGSRGITDYAEIHCAIHNSRFMVTEVVSGTARGADILGEQWAVKHGIPCVRFPADWDGKGRGAGFVRNAQMAAYADALVAVWDGRSSGTAHMIQTMQRLGKPVHVHSVCHHSL